MPNITVSPAAVPNGTVGSNYGQTITASGGSGPYTYAVGGTLPPGLILLPGPVLYGTATTAGTFNFIITATDQAGNSGSRAYSVTISPAATTTVLSSNPNPSTTGQAVTFTAVVIPAMGGSTPTGTVTFTSGNVNSGPVTLTSGSATFTTTALPVGSDTVTATYTSNPANFSNSSGTTTQTVNAATSTTTVSASPNPSTYGQTVTLTATITNTSGLPAPGSVVFTSNGATLGTANYGGSGPVSIQTNALPGGSDTVTATYTSSSANFSNSSGATTVTVNAGNTTTTVSAAPNPSTFGQTVTLTAAVTSASGTPTGSVTFTSGNVSSGPVTLTNGTATYSTAALPVGTDTVTATYTSGSANFANSSGATTQTVDTAATTTTVSAAPNSSTSGQAVTLTATVASGGGTPTGTVTFTSGNVSSGPVALANGQASFTTTALPVGTDTVTATYTSGSASFANSSGTTTVTVNAGNTATTVSAAPNPSTSGQAVTLTATVTSAAGTPTGAVTFTSNGATLGTAALSGGVATLSTTALPVGADTVTASYGGTANFAASQGSATQTVNPGTTTTALAAAPNPSTSGQAVTLTATVTSASGTPTGIVIFTSNGATLGQANLAGGVATLTTAALPVGADIVTAAYGGAAGFATSSGQAVQQVKSGNTTTAVSASPNPSTSSQAVTLTATVTSASGTPTGTVTFTSNGATLGTANLAGGVATLTTAALPVGADTIVATYGGAAGFATSSGQTTQQVNAGNTTTALAAAPNPSASGQAVTLTATVTSPSGTPTGTVTFTSNGATLGTANLAGGVATLTTAALPVGTDTLVASYGGAAGFATSSGQTTQQVNAGNTTTALTSAPNPSTAGQAVTLTATVTSASGTPTGTVTFTSNGATLGTANLAGGVATLTTTALPVGTDAVTAAYGGATGFATSSGQTTQQVNAGNTTTALSAAPNPSTSGQAVTLTAIVTSASGTPTGTVTFTSNGATLGQAALSSGVATITTMALPVGADTVTAAYGGATGFATSSGQAVQHINAGNTTTAVTSAPNPSAAGQAVTLSATVSSASGTPTGTVTFTSNGATLGQANLAGGVATLTTAALPVGADTIVASYGGAAGFATSSGQAVQQVNAGSTTTALSAAPNPSITGQAVTLTATVTSPAGTPTGTVIFASNGATLGQAALSSGVATLTTTALPVGADTVTASYGGAAGFAASSGSTVQTVNDRASTTTALAATPNPSTVGRTVTFTATVTGRAPTGAVTFSSGGTVLGTASLASGVATFGSAALAAGANTVTAAYGGDAGNAASTSPPLTEQVNAVPTTTRLASSVNPSVAGQPVRLTATVIPAASTAASPGRSARPAAASAAPTGTVTFRDGNAVLGTATLSGGTATLLTSAFASGANTLKAVYAGDATFAGSASAALIQGVQSATGTLTLSVSASGRDGSFAFTSTLPGAGAFTLATVGGAASRSFAGLPAGTYAITAAGLPPGFAAQGFTCSTGSANGSTETFTVTAGSTVSCSYGATFDAAAVQKATQAAIRTFLQQRAELLAQAEPDHRRMHERMTGTVFGGEDEDTTAAPYGKMPVDVNAFSSNGSTNLSASTSLSQLLRPMDKIPFEIWTDVRFGSFRDSPTNNGITGFTPNHYQGSSTMAFTGVDYRVMPGVLFGLLGEYDQTGQVSSTLGTSARGAGYMVGPYASVALTRNLFFDARAAFGQSANAITPDGLLRDHFDTDRQLYRGELSGLFNFGALEIAPSISALHFQEQQRAFTDAFGLLIGKQTVGLGQAAAGPEFAYPIALDGSVLTPRFAAKAVYDFQRDAAAAAALGIGQPTATLRGRLEGGLDLDNWMGFGIGSSVSYDGLGDRHYSAVTGRLAVKKTFDVRPEGVFATP